MKKIISCMMLMLAAVTMVKAEETALAADTTAAKEEGKGVYPYEIPGKYENVDVCPEKTGLSLFFPLGMTFADMDETGGAHLGSGLSNLTMNLGFGLEYNFTPTWGLMGEFTVANYGKHSFKSKKDPETGKREEGTSFGNAYNMDIMLTYDLADGFFPQRKSTLVSAYFLLGAGLGFYQYQSENDVVFANPYKDKEWDWDPYLTGGFMLDFNITREFGLGARVTYNYYMSDNLDFSNTNGSAHDNIGRLNSNNDGMFYADLVLRYKINGNKKSHVRNMGGGIWDELYRPAAGNCDCCDNIDSLINDKLANLPKDTVVVHSVDTVILQNPNPQVVISQDDVYVIYFPFDKYYLDEVALAETQRVAMRMLEHPEECVQLAGYTDYMGTVQYNEVLSQRRAETVRQRLINEYGISPDRILDNGRGRLDDVKDRYARNRRVDVRFVTREQMERLRNGEEIEIVDPRRIAVRY